MADRNVATTDTLEQLRTTYNSTATDVGDITQVRNMPVGTSSLTYGYTSGGYSPYNNIIDKFSFSSDGNATDVGDLQALNAGYGGGGFHV